jgi:fructose-1,6-bisphosphatase
MVDFLKKNFMVILREMIHERFDRTQKKRYFQVIFSKEFLG